MKKNNLVIILSHCDTKEKINLLENNIKQVKEYGLDILLASHIPLSKSIQSSVDYIVYDKSNPLLVWPERGMCHWKSLWWDDARYRLDTIFPDTGWTALNQIKLSSSLGLSLDYDYYTFINYDTVLTDNLMDVAKTPQNYLDGNDDLGVYLTRIINYNDWEGEKKIVRKSAFPGMLFNMYSKEKLQSMIPLISRGKYLTGIGCVNSNDFNFDDGVTVNSMKNSTQHTRFTDAEQYLYSLINNFKYKIHPEFIEEHTNTIVDSSIQPFNLNNYNDDFKIICDNGNRVPHPYKEAAYNVLPANKIKNIVIYDLKKDVIIQFNDEVITLNKNHIDKNGQSKKHLINGLNGVEDVEIKKFGFFVEENKYVDLLSNIEHVKNSPVIRTIMEWDYNEK